MRLSRTTESGSAQVRWVIVIVILLVLGAIALVLLRRPPAQTPPIAISSGPAEISRTNLVLTDGRLHELTATNPFTGIMLERYADGGLRSRSAVSNGWLQGLSQGYYTNGQIQVAEQFVEGVSDGMRTKWYPDGVKQSEAGIAQGKLHGAFRRWHENGTLSEQVEFVNGQPEGESLAYYPSGFLKARVIMKEGKPVEQKFWEDGEHKP